MRWDHYAKIIRNEEAQNINPGSNWNFDDGSGTNPDPGPATIYEKYPCAIIEKIASYDTSEKGQSYTGKAKMKGMLTDKLKKGDIIDGEYKIAGRITHPHNKYTQCNLVRIK